MISNVRVRHTADTVTLKEIFENPEQWNGKEVLLEVEYLGWGIEGCKKLDSSIRTRSDVTFKEDDICIFADPVEELNPKEKAKVKIKAVVEIYFGKPRLKNVEVLEKM